MPAISFLPFLQTVPMGTRILTLTLCGFTLGGMFLATLSSSDRSSPGFPSENMPWLVLSPGESWRYPWVLWTAGWVELGIVELAFSAVSLFFACRYLERVWGFYELVRFSSIVIVGTNIIAFGFAWLTWFVLGSEEALNGLPFHGLTGLQVGFLVAFTQLIPEHQLQLFGALKMRVKTLPGIYLLISNVLVILLGPSPYILIQFGFIVAWWYLRFFKLSENGDIRGDRSETFAFQYWFPPPIRPYISIVANHVFKLAVRFRLVQSWEEVVGGGSGSGGYQALPGPGQARAEAERRRALALKALDARLASGTSPNPPAVSPGGTTTSGPAAIPNPLPIPSGSGIANLSAGVPAVTGGSTTIHPPAAAVRSMSTKSVKESTQETSPTMPGEGEKSEKSKE